MKRLTLVAVLAGAAVTAHAGTVEDKMEAGAHKISAEVDNAYAVHKEKVLARKMDRAAKAVADAKLNGQKAVVDSALNGGNAAKTAVKATEHYDNVVASRNEDIAEAAVAAKKARVKAAAADVRFAGAATKVATDAKAKAVGAKIKADVATAGAAAAVANQ